MSSSKGRGAPSRAPLKRGFDLPEELAPRRPPPPKLPPLEFPRELFLSSDATTTPLRLSIYGLKNQQNWPIYRNTKFNSLVEDGQIKVGRGDR